MSKEIEIIDFDDIDVYLIDGNRKNNPKNLINIHQKSFMCWYETWNEYYHGEHESDVKMNSNEFTRQDNILSLFYKGECFALTFFKEIHWSDPSSALDSYFNIWTPEAIQSLRQHGDNIMICSQFTVAKNFRKGNVDIPWKNILLGMLIKRFIESDADAMTGTMRVTKNMGKMVINEGATPLALGIPLSGKEHENESVDLVGFFHKEVEAVYAQNPYHQKFDALWERINGRLYSQLRLVA
jgi:hypothetical protein